MNSPTESRSAVWLKNCSAFSSFAARLNPVATGSMKTRSLPSRIEYGLSTRLKGGLGNVPSSFMLARRGPSAPRCSHTEEEPGPPLKQNVTGRVAALVSSSARVRDVKNRGARRPVGFQDRQHSGFGHVGHALPGHGHGVGGKHRLMCRVGNGHLRFSQPRMHWRLRTENWFWPGPPREAPPRTPAVKSRLISSYWLRSYCA